MKAEQEWNIPNPLENSRVFFKQKSMLLKDVLNSTFEGGTKTISQSNLYSIAWNWMEKLVIIRWIPGTLGIKQADEKENFHGTITFLWREKKGMLI